MTRFVKIEERKDGRISETHVAQKRVFKERTDAFNDRQRRGAMRRKIHEVTIY